MRHLLTDFLRRGDTFLRDFRSDDPFAKGVTSYEKQSKFMKLKFIFSFMMQFSIRVSCFAQTQKEINQMPEIHSI